MARLGGAIPDLIVPVFANYQHQLEGHGHSWWTYPTPPHNQDYVFDHHGQWYDTARPLWPGIDVDRPRLATIVYRVSEVERHFRAEGYVIPFLTAMYMYCINRTIFHVQRLYAYNGMMAIFPMNNPRVKVRCRVEFPNNRNEHSVFYSEWSTINNAIQTLENTMGQGNALQSMDIDAWLRDPDRGMWVDIQFLLGQYDPFAEGEQLDFGMGADQEEEDLPPPPPYQAQPPGIHFERDDDLDNIVVLAPANLADARIRYNLRNQTRVDYAQLHTKGGRRRHGATPYSEWKRKKLFRKGNIENFFRFTDMCIYTPDTYEQMCFPMAFMKAQLRTFVIQEGMVKDILESKPQALGVYFEMDHYVEDEELRLDVQLRASEESWMERDFLTPEGKILLFNPYKQECISLQEEQQGLKKEYRVDYDDDYVIDWNLAARQIHHYVEEKIGKGIDYMDEEEGCKAYAKVFNVNIHLGTVVNKSYRYRTYHGNDRTRHIHLVSENGHMCSVSNIRAFNASSMSSMKVNMHNFCDICYKITTNDNVKREAGLEHISECLAENTDCVNYSLIEAKTRLSSDLRSASHVYTQKMFHCHTCGKDYNSILKKCQKDGHCTDTYPKLKYSCKTCGEKFVSDRDLDDHLCYMKLKKIPPPLDDKCLWIYDMEACQKKEWESSEGGSNNKMLSHQCILVCIRRVYEEKEDDSERLFSTIDDFCLALVTEPQFKGAVFLAHNGAGYDSQYILQYCERSHVVYDRIPHPSSSHKSLCLTIHRKDDADTVKFLDFMAFVPGSLKSIGKSFGLSIAKGDFPHMFSVPSNQNYIGSIPKLESLEDYFGYYCKKSEDEQKELKEWYEKECETTCSCEEFSRPFCVERETCTHCGKKAWNFQEELIKYCKMDVKVLAQVVKLYREGLLNPDIEDDNEEVPGLELWQCWRCPAIDPFQYMTMSQVAMEIFMHGFPDHKPLLLASSQYSDRDNYHPWSADWIREKNEERKRDGRRHMILYRGNRIREYFSPITHTFYDGYLPAECRETPGTIFIFRDCEYHACQCCYPETEGLHRKRNMKIEVIRKNNDLEKWKLRKNGYHVEEKWACQHTPSLNFTELIQDREMLYGGRTEVFQAYYDVDLEEGEELKYIDVCSLYPWVCAFKEMPVDHPQVLTGSFLEPHRLHPDHPHAYWGFAKVKIIPSRKDELGILPSRDADTGRLEFNLLPKTGTWHTEEIYLAIRQGYVVEEIVQVYHWSPSKRSDSLFRGYVSHFLKQKQEADGWKKAGASCAEPGEEEQLRVVEELCISNGGIGRMNPKKVAVNPVKRQISKLNLNCIWGKFVQTRHEEFQISINGCREYFDFLDHPNVDQRTIKFRHVKDNLFKVDYKRIDDKKSGRNNYNVWIGSSVTAHARNRLNGKALEIGSGKVCYSDTDSLVFAKKPGDPDPCRKGLGQWQDEKPNKKIMKFIGLAPKNYFLEMEDEEELEMKSKGVVLNVKNRKRVNVSKLEDMIALKVSKFAHPEDRNRVQSIQMDNFSIYSNSTNPNYSYGQLFSLFNEKIMQSVLTKRKVVPYYNKNEEGEVEKVELGSGRSLKKVRLLPYGHEDLDLNSQLLSKKMYH